MIFGDGSAHTRRLLGEVSNDAFRARLLSSVLFLFLDCCENLFEMLIVRFRDSTERGYFRMDGILAT